MKWLICFFVCGLAACSESKQSVTVPRGPSFPPAEKVKVDLSVSRSPEDEEKFRLADEEAAKFINSADIVSGREIHDYYDVMGNAVTGTAEIRGMRFRWSIDAGGTGSLTRELDGAVFRIADPAQRDAANLAR